MKHRTCRFYLTLAVSLTLAVVFVANLPKAWGQAPNEVGLAVRFGDGTVITRCIEFSEAEISGYDVLLRSGLNVVAAGDSSLGMAICKIGEEGCPAQDCFCQCKGSTCLYWSYWHLGDGSWKYSLVGASGYTAHHGDVEGWNWGTGEPPPVIPLDQICLPPSTPTSPPTDTPLPTATWTPSPVPTPTDTPQPTPTWTPLSLPTPTDAPVPTATWTPSPAPTQTPVPPTETSTSTDTPSPETFFTPAPTLTPTPTLTLTDTPQPTPTPTPTSPPQPTPTAIPTSPPPPSATSTMKPLAPSTPTPTQIARVIEPSTGETKKAVPPTQQSSGLLQEAINLVLFFILLTPLVIGWIVVQVRQRRR